MQNNAPSSKASASALAFLLHCTALLSPFSPRSPAFFIDKPPACYYNNVVKMASLRGFAPARNK
ncbi:hypothetical protein CGS49_07710 [Faecalibacterium langellae]|uniref:Uncharacterized protein n=1 Tax=Faecalibacterium langellae TaxID=3435293 RepID=A0ACC9CYQ5_9FIRM|nr:hypothetical protein CGS49_07710 [Faecalibacterium prausnitzii]